MAAERDWDCYTVVSEKNNFVVIFMVSRTGKMGIHSATFIDLSIPFEHSEHIFRTYPSGRPEISEKNQIGNTVYRDDPIDFYFKKSEKDTWLYCTYKKFYSKKPLSCIICLKDKMADVTLEDDCAFSCMRASGKVDFLGKEYSLDPQTDYAMFLSGRDGIRREEGHRGAVGCGTAEGKPFCYYLVNSDLKSGDSKVIWGDKVIQTGKTIFEAPDDYSTGKRVFHSQNGKLYADFTRKIEYSFKNDMGFMANNRHTLIGNVSGKLEYEDGVIEFRDVFCLIEHVRRKALRRK